MATNSQIIPIIAYSNGQIVGWLAIYTGFGKIGFIGKWHPIVRVGSDQDTIAKNFELITPYHMMKKASRIAFISEKTMELDSVEGFFSRSFS
jgi:hypothetical protein